MPTSRKAITSSMPPELAEQVQQLLKEEGRTMSEFLREAIRLYMEEREWLRRERRQRAEARQTDQALIEEWRRLWKTHSAGGRGLAWLEVEERVRELEVAMLEEHGLTLPPETMPLTGPMNQIALMASTTEL